MERYPTDKNSAHPNYVKTSGQQIIYLYAEQIQCFRFQPRMNTVIFITGCYIHTLKNISTFINLNTTEC